MEYTEYEFRFPFEPPLRSERIYLNAAEEHFAKAAYQSGLGFTKRGWPDFLCWDEDDNVGVVEVKPSVTHPLKREQEFVMRSLARAGIPAMVWSPGALPRIVRGK